MSRRHRRHRRLAGALALTVALSASVAPVAASGKGPIRSGRSRITSQALLLNGALARPSAAGSQNLCSEVCSAAGYRSPSSPASAPAYTGPRSEVVSGGGYGTPGAPVTVVRVPVPDGSFDWGDAGIGAGAALVLFGVGLAGTRAAATSRGGRTREWRSTVSS